MIGGRYGTSAENKTGIGYGLHRRCRKVTVSAQSYAKRIFFDTHRERIDLLDGRERHIKGTGEQGFHMQGNDLVQRLRDRAYSGLPDPLSEQAADKAVLLPAVEVVPIAEALARLPPPSPVQ